MGTFKKNRADGTSLWYYDFMYNRRRFRGIGGTTKTQALRTLEHVRTEVINETYQHSKEMNTKFEDISEEFLTSSRTNKRSWIRDEQLVKNLSGHFKAKMLNQIKPSDIETYKTKRKSEGVSGSTINREIAALKRIFNIAIKNNRARYNPVKDVPFMKEPPGRTRYLLPDDINNLLSNCCNQVRPVVITALNTGMRLQEILSLTWDRIYIENVINPYLEITETKNGKKRFIPLNSVMRNLFEEIRKGANGQVYVFINRLGRPLRKVTNQFKFALNESDITDFKFHDLRHTFASHYVMNGGDLLSLKEILGHSSLKMVERYAHLSPSHKQKLIENLNFSDKYCEYIATNEKKALSV